MPQNKESSEPKANHNISSRLAERLVRSGEAQAFGPCAWPNSTRLPSGSTTSASLSPHGAYPDNFAGRQRKLTTKCWVGCGVWPADPLLIVSQTPPKEACILKEAFPLPRRSALQLVLVPLVEPSSESAVASTDARRCACARPIFAPTVRRGISGQA